VIRSSGPCLRVRGSWHSEGCLLERTLRLTSRFHGIDGALGARLLLPSVQHRGRHHRPPCTLIGTPPCPLIGTPPCPLIGTPPCPLIGTPPTPLIGTPPTSLPDEIEPATTIHGPRTHHATLFHSHCALIVLLAPWRQTHPPPCRIAPPLVLQPRGTCQPPSAAHSVLSDWLIRTRPCRRHPLACSDELHG
jgi:hypothetical protein